MKTFSKYNRMLSLALLLALTLGAADSFAQANHNVTRSNKTQPAAGNGVDDDCDGVCTTLHGTLHRAGDDLLLYLENEGQPPMQVRLVRDGGTEGGTRAQDYNSSRSNNSSGRASSDGSLEHTDDWIAARATASTNDDPASLHIPTDVHSGKLTGVRQHSPHRASAQDTSVTDPTPIYMSINDGGVAPVPTTKDLNSARSNVASGHSRTAPQEYFTIRMERVLVTSAQRRQHQPIRVTKQLDKATPQLYHGVVDTQGRFKIEIQGAPVASANVEYVLVVTDSQEVEYRGHVTVLK